MAGTSLNSCSLLLLFVAAVNGIVYDPGVIILRSADVSVPISKTLPLSCVSTSDDEDLVDFLWEKNVDGSITTVDALPITQSYSSTNGRKYAISTILLCDLGFSDSGMYSCRAVQDLTSHREYTLVVVHIPTLANFQLRLTGVSNCEGWVSTNSPTKLQSVIDHLENNILDDVCFKQCHFSITNPQFSCVGDLNATTFSATVEHRLYIESLNQTASDVVAMIGSWKDSGASLIVSSQSLFVESSCVVDSSTLCGTVTSEVGNTPLGIIVGGGLGGVVLVCVVVVVIVLAVVIMKRYGKKRQPVMKAKQIDSDYTHFSPNMAYGTSTGSLKAKQQDPSYAHVDQNIAYVTSSCTAPPQQGSSCKNMPLPPVEEDVMDDYTPMNMNVAVYNNLNDVSRESDYEQPTEGPSHEGETVYDYIPGNRM